MSHRIGIKFVRDDFQYLPRARDRAMILRVPAEFECVFRGDDSPGGRAIDSSVFHVFAPMFDKFVGEYAEFVSFTRRLPQSAGVFVGGTNTRLVGIDEPERSRRGDKSIRGLAASEPLTRANNESSIFDGSH